MSFRITKLSFIRFIILIKTWLTQLTSPFSLYIYNCFASLSPIIQLGFWVFSVSVCSLCAFNCNRHTTPMPPPSLDVIIGTRLLFFYIADTNLMIFTDTNYFFPLNWTWLPVFCLDCCYFAYLVARFFFLLFLHVSDVIVVVVEMWCCSRTRWWWILLQMLPKWRRRRKV